MKKTALYFLTGIALAIGVSSARAQEATSVSIPEGMITFNIAKGVTSYLSLPLTNNEVYTGSVVAVTSTSISVGDSPAPFTTSLVTAPYFVKFLSGNEIGRTLLITANSTSTLTLDTTDHTSSAAINLDTAGFNVQIGDTFQIFPADTLASVFGAGTTQSPLLLSGGTNIVTSDTVSLFTSANAPAITYYFNTADGIWEQYGTRTNANNAVIYPYSAFAVTRRMAHPSTNIVISGRVTSVMAQTRTLSNATVFTSTHYATDIKLSELQFGANWVKGDTIVSADTLSVWNAASNHFDTYFQKTDSTWRKYPDMNTDQSSFAIPAGAVTTITKREAVAANGASFIQAPVPYSLD
jgi:uncharacterized protein (TIGR02597 family)